MTSSIDYTGVNEKGTVSYDNAVTLNGLEAYTKFLEAEEVIARTLDQQIQGRILPPSASEVQLLRQNTQHCYVSQFADPPNFQENMNNVDLKKDVMDGFSTEEVKFYSQKLMQYNFIGLTNKTILVAPDKLKREESEPSEFEVIQNTFFHTIVESPI